MKKPTVTIIEFGDLKNKSMYKTPEKTDEWCVLTRVSGKSVLLNNEEVKAIVNAWNKKWNNQ
jgi:hypothetical protein